MIDELSDRERRVLAAIIESHVLSRGPVASRTLADQLDLGVSPQTVRNVMSQLADRGLIEKPHSSAGRIPTASGLRFYVDALLRLEAPPTSVTHEITTRIRDAQNMGGVVDEAGRVLARLSRSACVVRAPKTENARLKHIELVRLREDTALVILVTEEGLVQNRLVEMSALGSHLSPISLDAGRLTELSRRLTAEVAGRTLEEARRHLRQRIDDARQEAERHQSIGHDENVADLIAEHALARPDPQLTSPDLRVEGERHLLDAGDGRSLNQTRELLQLVETKQPLLELLDEAAAAPGVRIFIGKESGLDELAGLTVIASGYGNEEGVVGGLGVIGPLHVDFARIVPLVRFTAEALSQALGQDKTPRPGSGR